MSDRNPGPIEILPATVSAVAVLTIGILACLAYELGPQSSMMASHIAAMNVMAPLIAALTARRLPGWTERPRTLWSAAIVQLVLLWAWHTPAVVNAVAGSHAAHVMANMTLLGAAFVFWCAIIRLPQAAGWQAIAALLLTGKLACLLAALMVFSPRELYALSEHRGHMDDQQLAGLLMIAACPLSYLIAAVVLASRIVNRLAQRQGHPSFRLE